MWRLLAGAANRVALTDRSCFQHRLGGPIGATGLARRRFRTNRLPFRAAARQRLPTLDRRVDVPRLEFDQSRLAAGLLSRNQRRARAAKGIENEPATMRRISNRVG